MGMKLLIIGAGGYGHLVKEIAVLNGYEIVDFLDDNSPLAIGKVNELEDIEERAALLKQMLLWLWGQKFRMERK